MVGSYPPDATCVKTVRQVLLAVWPAVVPWREWVSSDEEPRWEQAVCIQGADPATVSKDDPLRLLECSRRTAHPDPRAGGPAQQCNKTYSMGKLCHTDWVNHRLRDLAEIANGQEGYVTRAQARAFISDVSLHRAVDEGRLVSPKRGAYRFSASPGHPHEALYAAWLLLDPKHTAAERLVDPDALVFGRSALEVLGLGGLPAQRHVFAVKAPRRLRRRDVALKVRWWGPRDWTQVEGMPVARPAWVVAEMVGEGADLDQLRMIVGDARRQRLDTEDLRARLGQLGSRGAKALEVLR